MITLFNYQWENLDLVKDKKSWAWFHETGTGKTILALENIKYLYDQKKIKAAVIAAPKTVLRPVWLKTLGEHYSGVMDFYVFQWIGGMSDKQEKIYQDIIINPAWNRNTLIILLCNIEAFSHTKIFLLVRSIQNHFKSIWIIDESTTIKGPNAKRTKQILQVAHFAQYKRILSGYPVLKTPEDLYSQIQFLGSELIPHRSFYAFRNDFCFTRKLDNRVTISTGARNVDKLQKLLQSFSSRVLKKDCLDLPEKVHTCRYVEMTAEQKQHYENMKKQGYTLLRHIEKHVFAQTLLSQLEKLHQIANGLFVAEEEYIDCNKYKILLDIIQNELGDAQVVIWSSYVMNIYHIQLTLLQAGISCQAIFGEISMNERNIHIELFVSGKLQVIVANPSTVMHGINWQNAHYAIYFNNSFHLEHRIQSEDRLHRIGQLNKVTYIDLITENTIEDKVLDQLEAKHNIGAVALGDQWESWFN